MGGAARFYRIANILVVGNRRKREHQIFFAAKSANSFSICAALEHSPRTAYAHFLCTRNLSKEVEEDSNSHTRSFSASLIWHARYQELIQYIKDHGNSLVPRDYKPNLSLGRWVDKQREKYKNNELSKERIDQLNAVQFTWQPNEELWSDRFDELLAYIKEHGNALVPQEYKENIALGHWVQKQRYKYKTAAISQDRIDQLNAVGFVWDVPAAEWLEKFELLKVYRREHGDTLVPRKHPLGSWVWWQRREYKAFIDRKRLKDTLSSTGTTGMTEERIRLLESEDFIFDPKEFMWDLKYQELREWIALNGHGEIAMRKRNNGPLEMWAARQRRMYKSYCNGGKSSLTKERIEKLQTIGFVFDLRK